jgi:hypothetical protein
MIVSFQYQLSPQDCLWVTMLPGSVPTVEKDIKLESRLRFYRNKTMFLEFARRVFGDSGEYAEFVSDIDLASVNPHGMFFSEPRDLTEAQIEDLGFFPFKLEIVP